MARSKTFLKNGEKVFERQIPKSGLLLMEKLTRPKEQKNASVIKDTAIEKNVVAP